MFIHELALNLGMTYAHLARAMTERELRQWQKYRMQCLLPSERQELYLAQIAQVIAGSMGGVRNAKLSDYLIELRTEGEDEEQGAEDVDVLQLQREFDFKPRK